MADPTSTRSSVSTDSSVTIKQRPTALLMIARVRASEATLDHGLVEVRQRSDDTVRRLTRMGAVRVWIGAPHTDDQADPDSLAIHVRAAAALGRPPVAAPANRQGVNLTVAAIWDIAGLTAEEVLTLVDRLRFDVAANTDPLDPPDTPQPWDDPMEHLQKMMAQAAVSPNDLSPKFLYITRASDDQLTQATAEAYRAARRRAQRLAGAVGQRLSRLSTMYYGHKVAVGHPERVMAQQRCAALLSTVGYELEEGEVASEDPRTAEVVVSVHVSHFMEE